MKIKQPAVKRNTPISEIAQELITYIKYDLCEFEEVIFICHSMGGLVAKNAVLDIWTGDYDVNQEILGYCSLATPHKGALSSAILGPININAKEMIPLDEESTKLNEIWVEDVNKLEHALYVRAKSDGIVNKVSSVPHGNKTKFKTEVVEADHESICKPANKEEKVFKIVKKFIIDCISSSKVKLSLLEERDVIQNSYDSEIFVIKLLLADVENILIDDAKDSFFSAEVILKRATHEERNKIKELSQIIISTYKTMFGANKSRTSSDIVRQIHEKIIDNDKTAFDCAVKHLNIMHKKGLLHQVANEKSLKVNWCNGVTLSDVEKYRVTVDD